ncbi:MAG: trypsin-like peptidase domain-containing protein [Parabacteroides sp.]|nr:trypsin-like peptidase domain-containing protein [bacterium]MDY4102786.1 trypsin-like peptidase domain-containing protein [Parabacteroides sp.]
MKHIVCEIVLIALLFMLNSCNKSLKVIIQESEDATFTVYTYDDFGSPKGSGSGFFINENGIGITNYHVLDGAVKATLKASNGNEYVINRVLASDSKWDIVKFEIKKDENERFPFLEFSENDIEPGDKVYNISSPLGLEKTVSEGIVSSVREDRQHGDIVQITAPISPGSSGSALINEKGKVFAVATFNRTGGQNLNFGVIINKKKLANLKKNDFVKRNTKFNSNDNFIIINKPSEMGSEIVLNAIEITESSTIGYFTFTNLFLGYGSEMVIWNEIGKDENGYRFTIEDTDTNQKYYIQSSTIGTTKENGQEVPLASSYTFKVFFSPISNNTQHIKIYNGVDSRSWIFSNIDLEYYRKNINIDRKRYQKEYAYAIMHTERLEEAESLLYSYLEDNETDAEALNALGIISFVKDNNSDAIYYFTKVIESTPMDPIGYFNRFAVYLKQQDYNNALSDIEKTIQCDPDQPDYYYHRGRLFLDIEEYDRAEKDFSYLVETNDFKKEAVIYMYRALCKMAQNRSKEACKDIYNAYNLTSDKQLEEALIKMWDDCGCR